MLESSCLTASRAVGSVLGWASVSAGVQPNYFVSVVRHVVSKILRDDCRNGSKDVPSTNVLIIPDECHDTRLAVLNPPASMLMILAEP